MQADDEQSDWPGPEPGISVMHLTDEDTDPDISFNLQLPRLSPPILPPTYSDVSFNLQLSRF